MNQPREDYTDTAYSAPQGPLETLVATVVADVLGIERVGRDDSFYDFGGTSLQAIRVCARIEKESGRKVEPVALFEHDVVCDLAEWLERATGGQSPAVHGQEAHSG